ncbi:MAG TPA: class I SAM-dependent methyltransferase [Saprospiraceae bacterium]|nr:class I SAM-dependent methyltransferase [Saprospiraceae bacterium]
MMEKIRSNPKTSDNNYSAYLEGSGKVWWKQILDVQWPYRWHIRSLQPGYTLDLGCGTGRNLLHLEGNGVGVDHNPLSVEIASRKGLQCFTNQGFKKSEFYCKGLFDTILLSHVAEHMEESQVVNLLTEHLPLLKSKGRVIMITPQEKGFRSDPTHIQYIYFIVLDRILQYLNLETEKQYSFPFPLVLGKIFTYNEFIMITWKM